MPDDVKDKVEAPAEGADKVVKPAEGQDKPADGQAGAPAGKPEGGEQKAPPAKAAATLLEAADDDGDEGEPSGEKPEGEQKKSAGEWPDDWREKIAKGNDKMLARLKRYASFEVFANAGISAQDKIRSGEYKAKLGEDATPEEIAAFREANDIPAEAKAYDIPNVAGHKWTEADSPVLDGFKETAHKLNLPQSAMNGIAEWYVRTLQEAHEKRSEKTHALDVEDREATEDALRSEFGAEYRPSMTLLSRLLDDREVFSEDAKSMLVTARDENGHRLINNPEFARLFIGMARERYGDAALITGEQGRAMSSRKAEIEKIRSEDINRYYREKLDDELLEINRREAQAGGRRTRAA